MCGCGNRMQTETWKRSKSNVNEKGFAISKIAEV